MKSRNNLELKHYCPDFVPVRMLLKKIGAKKIIVKKQKDFFFNLPTQKGTVKPRMKLRVEKGKQLLVWYVRPDFSSRVATRSGLMLFPVASGELLPLLSKALGVSAVVEKQRELWRKGDTVFHLDRVQGVGNIFEIEVQKKGLITAKERKLFADYQKLLAPYLGKVIKGSNGDLVARKR